MDWLDKATEKVFDFAGDAYEDGKEYLMSNMSAKYEVEKAKAENKKLEEPDKTVKVSSMMNNTNLLMGGGILLIVLVLLLKK